MGSQYIYKSHNSACERYSAQDIILHGEETLGGTELTTNIMNCRVSNRCDQEMA